jgi:hypothetical protein
MKKLRLLFCLLVVVCIITSSSTTFSAMPQGKFPIQICSSRTNPNNNEIFLIKRLEKAFNNSPDFRVTNTEENRIILGILINEYIPSVISSDVLASAAPIKSFSLVWLARPKNKHTYFIWHNSGRFQTYEDLTEYIVKEAYTTVWNIKNNYPYVFD